MKIFKTILCALIACSTFTPAGVFAETYDTDFYFESGFENDISLYEDSAEQPPITEDEKAMLIGLADSFENRTENIEIDRDLQLTKDRFLYLWTNYLGQMLQSEYTNIFYVKASTGLRISGNYVVGIKMQYEDEEYIEMVNEAVNGEIENVRSLITDDMTDLQKALAAHDYIASNYEYDTTYENKNLDDMVLNKTGVCQGYSYLFKEIMNALGIPCVTVPSNECNHMWNKVMINGAWYNVDVTYDDPLFDMSTHISHKYFIVNDEEIKALDSDPETSDHLEWNQFKWDGTTPSEVSAGVDFLGTRLHEINGATVCDNGKFYCFDSENNLCELVFDSRVQSLVPIYTPSSEFQWLVFGTDDKMYASPFSAITAYDGNLYFNSPDKVYKFNPSSNTARYVYIYDGEADISGTYLYGLKVKDNVLYAEYCTSPNGGDEILIDILSPSHFNPENICGSDVEENSETGEITVKLTIPGDLEKEPAVYIAEYDENGLFLGLIPREANASTVTFVPGENIFRIKTFIWDSNNTPLADMSALDLK